MNTPDFNTFRHAREAMHGEAVRQALAPMNAQTPGPLRFARSHEDQNGPLFELEPGETKPIKRLYAANGAAVVACHDLATIDEPDARLLAAAYTAFDKAGRELGIDAATLAERIDLADVICFALDYAKLHTDVHARQEVGRPDQARAARLSLDNIAAMMGQAL